jgi:signal transduction histidine kinase
MAGWSIRRKLGLVVTIPLIVLLVGGGLLVASLGVQYRNTHTAKQYADALGPIITTQTALTTEFVSPGPSAPGIQQARERTDAAIAGLQPRLAELSKGDGSLASLAGATRDKLNSVGNTRSLLDDLVKADQPTDSGQAQTATGELFTTLAGMLNALAGQLQSTTPDSNTASGGQVVGLLARTGQAAATERQTFSQILGAPKDVTGAQAGALNRAIATEDQLLAYAKTASTDQRVTEALMALDNQSSQMSKWRQTADDLFVPTSGASGVAQGDQQAWQQFADRRIATMGSIAAAAAADSADSAGATERNALLRVGAVAAAVVITLVLVTALLAAIARSVTGPLRRLRAGAVEVASVQLPAAVARIEQDGVAADVTLPPVLPADAVAGPETIEVARAVDDLGAEAVRLATAQVRLRRALDEAFVSMSRRSQSMVEKQLAIIDELESQEQDPDQLRNLFRLDHLAARMRRYNDNLLVLAGSAVRTRATAPVKVAELFRAATSEMEQYERVRLQPVSGASISGTVAGELVHLLAELLDNAAMYSPPSSPIVLSAAFTADGGLQIEVLDAGVGISQGELDRLNARLTQPESIDTQVPSRMGLFVVARLARRGTFGVMLQSRPDAAGTVALVRVPATLVIGAPGNTGEHPVMPVAAGLRTATPPAGIPQRPAYAPPPAVPASTTPSPAATAAGAAAQAAAGVRQVSEDRSAALPRRRRAAAPAAPAAFNTAGLPPEAVAQANLPAADLFSPNVPTGAEADEERPGVAALNRGPAETSPTGFPSLRPPARPNGADQPVRGGQNGNGAAPPTQSQPIAVNPLNGMDDTPLSSRPVHHDPGHVPPAFLESLETPAAGISGLPGLAAPRGREDDHGYPDPLTAPTGQFHTQPNLAPPTSAMPVVPVGDALDQEHWDADLPTELAARAAAAAAYRPADPNIPLIGENVDLDFNDPTPIFDQISVWFTAEPTGAVPVSAAPAAEAVDEQVIDLRDEGERRPSSRWASLGDQRWLATNARAAAAPDTEGTTETGLPKRRPGANLLPSAATAAPSQGPAPRPRPVAPAAEVDQTAVDEQTAPDADLVRGRLGSYQRGLANARRARTTPAPAPAFDPVGASLFTANSDAGNDGARHSGEQGGDQ